MQKVSEETSLYFAGKGNQIEFDVDISNPEHTPVKINLYVLMWGGTTEVKKSLSPSIYSTTDNFTAKFDINNVLHSELFHSPSQRTFAFPANPDAPMRDRTDIMLLKFYLDWSYSYIDENGDIKEAARTDNSSGTQFYAIQGGISRVFKSYILGEDTTFFGYLNEDDTALKFLSWIPNNMLVHPSMPIRLWFYNDNKIDSINLKLQATFTDGTVSDILDRGTLETTKGLVEIACGPVEMRTPTIDISKTVDNYSIWVENTDGTIKSEVKTFVIDYNTYERNDILFFRNSLGVNEVMWCHGRRKDKIITSSEERTLPLNDVSLSQGSIRSYRGTLEYPFEMNSGWFKKSDRHYLADFLSAGEAMLPVNFFMLPVIVKTGTFTFGEDGIDMFSVAFKIQVAHKEYFYSPVPDVPSPWGDFNDDFNLDFF